MNTLGTGIEDDEIISERVQRVFDFRPQAIIESLKLRSPIFARTASGGHFGRMPDDDGGFTWEILDNGKIEDLKSH